VCVSRTSVWRVLPNPRRADNRELQGTGLCASYGHAIAGRPDLEMINFSFDENLVASVVVADLR
jgi:hypothetical protein